MFIYIKLIKFCTENNIEARSNLVSKNIKVINYTMGG